MWRLLPCKAQCCVANPSLTVDLMNAPCGSRLLLGIARISGGTLPPHRLTCSKKGEDIVLFNLEITIDLKQIETKDLNTAVEVITSLIGPSLGRGRASFHINVEPAQHVPEA